MENKTFTALQIDTSLGQSAQCYFYVSGTSFGTLAPVYGSNVIGTPLVQPLTTNAQGQVSVWSPNGQVDVKMVPTVGATQQLLNVTFYDASQDTEFLTNVASVGSGTSLVYSVAAQVADFKSIAAGSNITLTDNGSGTVTIAAAASGGTVTGASSDGTGTAIYNSATSTSTTLHFKSIAAGAGISVTDNGSGTVTIANTASGPHWIGKQLLVNISSSGTSQSNPSSPNFDTYNLSSYIPSNAVSAIFLIQCFCTGSNNNTAVTMRSNASDPIGGSSGTLVAETVSGGTQTTNITHVTWPINTSGSVSIDMTWHVGSAVEAFLQVYLIGYFT